jgi:hypothetical protein
MPGGWKRSDYNAIRRYERIQRVSARFPKSRLPNARISSGARQVRRHWTLLQIFDFLLQCCEQWRRQFGIAFLDCKLLAIRVYPIQEIA